MNPTTVRSKTSVPLLVLSILVTLAGPATAADIRVTRYDDPAPGACSVEDCSLREAVISASADSTSDRILLSAGSYNLTRAGVGEDEGLTGDLDVYGDVEIIGAGATMTTIDANGIDRVLYFEKLFPADQPRLEGVSITGGLGDGTDTAGIRIDSSTDLTIERCEIFGNDNGTNGFGAIKASIGTTLILIDTTVRDNLGGGLDISQGAAQMFNVTLSNNGGNEISATGAAAVYCNHCTIRDDGGDAEINLFSSATLELANTAVIGNCAFITGGAISSFGGNLESPGATCDLDLASDQDAVVTHGFGALADNGGETSTHFPAVTSPAVGNANDTFCPPNDQRGASRPDTNCDVGAVERVTVRPRTPIFADGFLQGDTEAWSDSVGD